MKYTKKDYRKAVEFALNYPRALDMADYDEEKDLFPVLALDHFGWHQVNLEGRFVRNCLKWQGIKKWGPDCPRTKS